MTTANPKNTYCVAIIPSSETCGIIADFKSQIEAKYKIKNANPFLPLIKLTENFLWDQKNDFLLVDSLKKYAAQSFSIELEFWGFELVEDSFHLKMNQKQQMSDFQRSLKYYLEIHNKIAFENYSFTNPEPKLLLFGYQEQQRKLNKIWTDLKQNSFNIHFIANKIYLINCFTDKYEIVKEFELE